MHCDGGLEDILQALVLWANRRRISLIYIRPEKPTQNAYIERFNWTARNEWLGPREFVSGAHAQLLATRWLWHYSNGRSNLAISGVPPAELLQAA